MTAGTRTAGAGGAGGVRGAGGPLDVGDVAWLDADEMRLWRAFVEVSGRVIHALDASLKADDDMGFDDYEVLVHLSEADDRRLRMTELGDRLLHSPSKVSQRVDRLARRGWVLREKCEDDGRGTYAVLTDHGLEVLAAAAPRHVADVRRLLLDHVRPEESDAFADVLVRVAAAGRD